MASKLTQSQLQKAAEVRLRADLRKHVTNAQIDEWLAMTRKLYGEACRLEATPSTPAEKECERVYRAVATALRRARDVPKVNAGVYGYYLGELLLRLGRHAQPIIDDDTRRRVARTHMLEHWQLDPQPIGKQPKAGLPIIPRPCFRFGEHDEIAIAATRARLALLMLVLAPRGGFLDDELRKEAALLSKTNQRRKK